MGVLVVLAAACDLEVPRDAIGEGPSIVSTEPADRAVDVPRAGPLRAEIDRLLAPNTVSNRTVGLESGALRLAASVRFEPVGRRIVLIPDAPLEPEITYRFLVDGVRDLDDRPQTAPYRIAFRTGEELGDPSPVTAVGWPDVEPLFQRSCVGLGCHGPGPAALGLDLSSGDAVAATALGRISRQLPGGVSGAEGARGGRGLVALPLIDILAGVGRPASSYLLYKALGDAHIVGEAMPPPSTPTYPPLSSSELERLSRWIADGARTF